MQMVAHIEPFTLATLDPKLVEQFDDAAAQIFNLFADESEKYESGTRKASIKLDLTFEINLEDRSVHLVAGVSAKLPEFRKVGTTLRNPRNGTRFLVEIEDSEQLDMLRMVDTDPTNPKKH